MRIRHVVALLVLFLPLSAFAQAEQKPMEMDCQKMMEKHQAMQAKMADMNAQLQKLVADMDAASGPQKVDKVAAVVKALVAQHTQMHNEMESMMPMMMQHGMEHMQAGMKEGMHSMENCPMMKKDAKKEAAHEH